MTRRKTLLVGGALGVLLLLAAMKLAAPLDLGRFRSRIEAAASRAALLDVTIHGEIVLSRWLPLEVVVHDLRLRVRDDELVKIPSVTLSSLELMPLFRKQLRMGAAVLAGELSLMAAFTSSDLARAHERLGRGGTPGGERGA